MLLITCTMSYVSLLSLQVCYEYTARFAEHDKDKFPQLATWDSVNHGGRYDAFELVAGIKESEVGQISTTTSLCNTMNGSRVFVILLLMSCVCHC